MSTTLLLREQKDKKGGSEMLGEGRLPVHVPACPRGGDFYRLYFRSRRGAQRKEKGENGLLDPKKIETDRPPCGACGRSTQIGGDRRRVW